MSLPPLVFGMIVRDEAAMLVRTLPWHVIHPFAARIAVDTGSSDATQPLLKLKNFSIANFEWKNDFSSARNELIALARTLCPNGWLLMLDADEAMWPKDILRLQDMCSMTKRDLIQLPRYNFAMRCCYYESASYPDPQPRCIRLSAPIEFRNKVHEVPFYIGAKKNISGEGKADIAQSLHIYHYGWCKRSVENWMRSRRYEQIGKNEALTDEAPDYISKMTEEQFFANIQTEHRFKTFTGNHPLSEHYA